MADDEADAESFSFTSGEADERDNEADDEDDEEKAAEDRSRRRRMMLLCLHEKPQRNNEYG